MIFRDTLLSTQPRYFPAGAKKYFRDLPIPVCHSDVSEKTTLVELPEWAAAVGVGSPACLLVPDNCIVKGESPVWQKVDWWRAAFQLMTCEIERQLERSGGPSHSYAYRLPPDLQCLWERAWVNRIFLFLRCWVSQAAGTGESKLLGERPKGIVYLTHDVDYVRKTLALRIKQIVFIKFNLIKSLLRADFSAFAKLLRKLWVFGFAGGNYWQFSRIHNLEAEFDTVSAWNFYGGVGGFGRSSSELLLDPAYQVADPTISQQLKSLHAEGHRIGLHQGFHSWNSIERMQTEKARLESALGHPVEICRQHWLRFSFAETWLAQEAVGFRLDATLGFNDRSGFRNSAALRMPAWMDKDGRFSESLETLPMVLMDSHLFDYGQLETDARRQLIDYYLDEIEQVGGEATVIWHHRVFHADYGWGDEYRYLLEGIKSRKLSTRI